MSDRSESDAQMREFARVEIALRWRDLDAFNHVNNSSFMTFLEEARLNWLSKLAQDFDGGSATPVMAAAHLNYRRQLTWPGTICVQLLCERVGTSSITIAHRIIDAHDDSIIYLDGNVVMVWIDPATGKPVALPQRVRAACEH